MSDTLIGGNMLDIKIVNFHKCQNLPQSHVIYLGRGRSNVLYDRLANQYTHKEGTIAKYKVETVEQAVEKFKQDLVRQLKSLDQRTQFQMRLLYERTKALSLSGTVYFQCWCKHELDPKPWDHACHCDVLRQICLTKYKSEQNG